MGVEITKEHRAAFMACLADADCEAALDLTLDLLAGGAAVGQLVRDLLVPAQREVGRRWERGEWTVADEHAATAVTDVVLSALTAELPSGDGHCVLVATATGEWHRLPARMAADALTAEGWRAQVVGPPAAAHDLARFAEVRRPLAVVLTSTMVAHLPGAWACVAALHGVGVPVVAMGAGFGRDGSLALAIGADRWAASGDEAVGLLRAWVDGPPVVCSHPERPATHGALLAGRDAVVAAIRSRAGVAGFDEVTDLLVEHGAQLAVAAALVERTDVVTDELPWMQSVATARGAPAELADRIAAAALDAVAEAQADVQRAR